MARGMILAQKCFFRECTLPEHVNHIYDQELAIYLLGVRCLVLDISQF